MLPIARMLVPAQFSKQPGRTFLIILSIALGVATLVATQSLKRGISEGKKDPFARGDLLVLNGRAGVPLTLADELARAGIPGVAGVQALVIGRALVQTEENPNRPVFVLGWAEGDSRKRAIPDLNSLRRQVEEQGLSLEVAASLNPLLLLSKTPVVAGGDLGLLGQPFTMRAGAGKLECLAVGAIQANAKAGDSRLTPVLGQVVAMGAIQAGSLIFPERPGTVSRLDLVLMPGADREKVRAAVAQKLGDRAEVHTVEEEESLVGDVTSGLELGFQVGGLGSLIVGLFLVYNVMSVGVEERRRFIGILRCAGGTRGQVAGLFLQEAACLGLAGSLLGIPLGLGIARLVVGPMGNALEEVLGRPTGEAAIHLDWSNSLLAVAAGLLTALVAALLPSWRASMEPPAGVVRQSGAGVSRDWLKSSLPILMLVGGLAFTAWCMVEFRHQLPNRLGAFGGLAVLLVACLLAAPLVASLVGRASQSLTEFLPGVGLRLAADNLVRSGQRTGLVIAALGATGALVVQTAGFLYTTETSVFSWVRDKVGADLLVTCGSGFTSYVSSVTMAETMPARVAEQCGPDLRAWMAVRLGRVDLDGVITYMLGVNMDGVANTEDVPLEIVHKARQNMDAFRSGGVFVSENFLGRHKKKVGDTLRIPTAQGEATLKILGSVVDYTWKDGTLLVHRDWHLLHFGDRGYDIIDVWLKKGADVMAVRQRLENSLGKSDALFVIDSPTMLDEIRSQLTKVNQLAYAQQSILGLVALLGVVSALFISVLQRKRQLGLLRAVGATRSQILWTVTAEALLMGFAGSLLGLVAGVLLEWYALDIMLWDEAGFRFPLLIPWGECLIVLGAGTLMATIIGLWPAYMATLLDIPEAVAQE